MIHVFKKKWSDTKAPYHLSVVGQPLSPYRTFDVQSIPLDRHIALPHVCRQLRAETAGLKYALNILEMPEYNLTSTLVDLPREISDNVELLRIQFWNKASPGLEGAVMGLAGWKGLKKIVLVPRRFSASCSLYGERMQALRKDLLEVPQLEVELDETNDGFWLINHDGTCSSK
jgi:hypothetical protein